MAESEFNNAMVDADLAGRKVRVPVTQIARQMSGETYAGTSYTIRPKNIGGVLRTTSGSVVLIVVPPASQLAASDNDVVNVLQLGAGQVTFVAGLGVTINTPETLSISKQYGAAMLMNTGPDEWLLAGYLEAAV
jgi:hypothetical protein